MKNKSDERTMQARINIIGLTCIALNGYLIIIIYMYDENLNLMGRAHNI